MSPSSDSEQVSPSLFFNTVNAYQRTAALKAAVDLDVFTLIGETPATAAEIALRCNAAQRGIRILCDYLAILGFLEKRGERYGLTPDSAAFLNRSSPAYAGAALEFLLSAPLKGAFEDLAAAVRKGGTAHSEEGTLAPEHPVWVQFARGMAPMILPAAEALAELVPLDRARRSRVLDVSAGHGMFGIAFAKRNPGAEIVALDWAPVLEVAREHARFAGIMDRFSIIAGSAFETEFGADYDVILIPNFLHHFDLATCARLLERARGALRPGGRVAIVEFVPNADRITPPESAGFSLVMLATTPAGDAYTFDELKEMLSNAGFHSPEQHPLPPTAETAVIALK